MSEIGEKLRRARLEAKMTQSRLCDGIVTRNMLSRIENGAARPSIGTLRALSVRLGLSAGYFLDGDARQFESHKTALIGDIRKRMANKDYTGAIERCAPFEGSEDDEINFILAVCFYNEAVKLYTDGNFRAVAPTFSTAEYRASQTAYPMPAIASASRLYIESIEAYKNEHGFFPLPPREYEGDIKLYAAAMKNALAGEADKARLFADELPDDIYSRLVKHISLDNCDREKYERLAASNAENLPLRLFILQRLIRKCSSAHDYNAEYIYTVEYKAVEEKIK